MVGLDCFTDYYPRPLKEENVATLKAFPNFRLVESRIQDADLGTLLDGVTHIFHLAAQAGVRKSWGRDFQTYTVNNVEATQVLLEACVGRPIEQLVYASTSSVYGDAAEIPMREDARPQPVSPYGVTKLAAEHLCMLYFVNYKVPAVALRYFTVYGPGQRPGHGLQPVPEGGAQRVSRSPCMAMASRPAISPSSATPSTRRGWPGNAACRAASTTLAAARASR